MTDNGDKLERAFHLETWHLAPAATRGSDGAQAEGSTVIDEMGRTIAVFYGEQHRENATRVLRALHAPVTRSREAQNYATRQLLRVNRRLKRHLAIKSFEVDAACQRALELWGGPPQYTESRARALRGMRTTFHEQALARLALVEAGSTASESGRR